MKKFTIIGVILVSSVFLSRCENSSQFENYREDVTDSAKIDHKSGASMQEELEKDRTFQELRLVKVIQSKFNNPKDTINVFEPAINSPKSAIYSKDGSKFYINSLEGCATVVFDSKTLKKIKEIRHEFDNRNNFLFKGNENTVFDYKYKQSQREYNYFKGKPVEGCLSHNGKYLWITYYRRDWDPLAQSPSAVAIIDVQKDEIIRVMPSGPLPKMIACSDDNKLIAVTHWGDNTVGLIDISDSDPMNFTYIAHIVVDSRLSLNFGSGADRDSDCGNCLRGTVFSPDSKKLFVAKMGGDGIAVIDLQSKKYIGTLGGSYLNTRHLILDKGYLYLSSNKYGVVQKTKLDENILSKLSAPADCLELTWETVQVGSGCRTIDITRDGKYLFACVNNACKIVIIDAVQMKKIGEVKAAPFPVGMSLSPDGNQLITTSQGKSTAAGSGNTVMVFKVLYTE